MRVRIIHGRVLYTGKYGIASFPKTNKLLGLVLGVNFRKPHWLVEQNLSAHKKLIQNWTSLFVIKKDFQVGPLWEATASSDKIKKSRKTLRCDFS